MTVVVPTGKLEPEATDGTRLATEQLSDAVGAVQVTVRAQVPGAFGSVIDAGVPEMNQGDGIHPNEAGSKIVAENVFRAIRPLLEKVR